MPFIADLGYGTGTVPVSGIVAFEFDVIEETEINRNTTTHGIIIVVAMPTRSNSDVPIAGTAHSAKCLDRVGHVLGGRRLDDTMRAESPVLR